MIKLTNILNELRVNNPNNITVEKAQQYYHTNIIHTNISLWLKYKKLCTPYCEKYDIFGYIHNTNDFIKLSQFDLNQFYYKMRELVRKYVGKEILNELNINNPNITAEKIHKYYLNNIRNNNNEFRGNGEGWLKYKQLCTPYCKKYEILLFLSELKDFQQLSQSDLNQFYREIQALVKKYNKNE